MGRVHVQTGQKKLIDKVIYVAAICYPLTSIPQIIKIFELQSASELSLITWLMYAAFETLFFIYGIQNRIKPLIVTGILWSVMYGLIIAGILLYG